MAIPKLSKEDILKGIEFIRENGVPDKYNSAKYRYELVTEDGASYPPKYVIAVANHVANGVEISVDGIHSGESKTYLLGRGFTIRKKQSINYVLTISKDTVESSDSRFSMDQLGLGDNYKPVDVYFESADGEKIKRNYARSEHRNSNKTMPRLAIQVFEKQLLGLSKEEKKDFPVCRYSLNGDTIKGIFSGADEYYNERKTWEYTSYKTMDGREIVIYCWNIFSTIVFVQECLKRFGQDGDKIVLIYQEKEENSEDETDEETEGNDNGTGFKKPYSNILLESKNIIFRGAPGTGKSYLAKEIAADIITNGAHCNYSELTDEQKKQVEFVQFHPNYDYSDFVEGLRPRLNEDGSMGFELQDGIFKKFIIRARKNYEDSQKTKEIYERDLSIQETISDFFSEIEFGVDKFKTVNGNEFFITDANESHIYISIPENPSINKLTLSIDEIKKMLESGQVFDKVKDVTTFFGKTFATQGYSYDFAIFKEIQSRKSGKKRTTEHQEDLKKYVFIIDEINRGEISKIFGELFYSIDPGYRGKAGEISTQYANLHSNPNEKFYIPENVFIIGTMNDIDRSVDTFDFAMRRRFRLIEIKANESLKMLDSLGNEELKNEVIKRMARLNNQIVNVEDLNENYQIGAAYFLKLNSMSFDQLWTDYLEPLLREYVHGMYDEDDIMRKFAKAYGYVKQTEDTADEDSTN